MAYDFTAASSHFVDWGDVADMSGQDYSFALWVYPEGAVNTGYAIGKTTGANGFFLRRANGAPASWDFGHNGASEINLSVTEDAWQHMIVTYDQSAVTAFMYKNATTSGTSTTVSDQIAAGAVLGIGNRAASDRDFEGRVCEVAIWLGHMLVDSQREALAEGFSPLFINPQPTFYAPLIRNPHDIILGATATNTNGTPVIEHPRMIYPGNSFLGFSTGAGGEVTVSKGAMLRGMI